MVNHKRGRPRSEGDRYPSGKLKPASSSDTSKSPIAPTLWQRIRTAGVKMGMDPRLGTELGRLALHDELTSAEVSAGFRIAEIYYRFEHVHGRSRSAGGSSFFKQFVADLEKPVDVKHRDILHEINREEAEREARDDFDLLQHYMPPTARSMVEQLCVDNRAISINAVPSVKITLRYFFDLFKDEKKYRQKRGKKIEPNAYKLKFTKPRPRPADSKPPQPAKRSTASGEKTAWMQMQRIMRPDFDEAKLEKAWAIYMALRDRGTFREEKAKVPT